MVYLSGITLAILPPEDRYRLIETLTKLRQQGTEIAFDSNFRSALWESTNAARHFYQLVFAITDLALVTNDDEQALWRDINEEQTLTRLEQQGIKRVALKMGPEGNLYKDFVSGQTQSIPTTPVENVIDTTSAGDSFNAGFLAGWLLGKSPKTCSHQGHQLAGTVIQHKGAIIPLQAMSHIQFQI